MAGQVLLKIVYMVTCRMLSLVTVLCRGDQAAAAEMLVLRHDNAALRRQVGRVRYEPADQRSGFSDRQPCSAREQTTAGGLPVCTKATSIVVPCNTQYATQHVIEYQRFILIRHAMLALLTEGPQYGLRLREEFEDRTGQVWPLNVGQVHTTLQRLVRDGLGGSDGSAAPPAGLTRGRRRVPDA